MKIRINDIECKSIINGSGHYDYEIVKWEECVYYKKEEEYLNNGWVLENGFFKRNNTNIDARFFTSPETCYVIAWLVVGKEDIHIHSVGNRLLDLNEDELQDFMEVYRMADKKIRDVVDFG